MSVNEGSSGSRRSAPLDRRYIERRDLNARRLLPAVERLLETATYRELSIDEMVAEAGISRSTFYNYFEDKNDLLSALTADVMTALTDATRVWWMLSPEASREDLGAAISHLYETYSPHAALMRAASESLSEDASVREAFEEYMRRGAEGIAAYIQAGQQAGVLRPELDPTAASEWLVWMFERGLSQLARDRTDLEPDRVVAAATDVLWKSLH